MKCIEAEIQSLTFGEILKIVATSEATWQPLRCKFPPRLVCVPGISCISMYFLYELTQFDAAFVVVDSHESEEFFIAFHSELLKSQIKDINGNSSLLLD